MLTRVRVKKPEGEWIDVELPDGSMRRDWVPADQPPPPGGYPGFWHVVDEADGATRWEWHPLLAPSPRVEDPSAPTEVRHVVEEVVVAPRGGLHVGYALLCFPGAAAVVSGVMLLSELLKR